MYERKFIVKNKSDVFIVINSKGKNIGLPPKSEVEVLAKGVNDIEVPNKDLVEITPLNNNEQFIDMGDHYVKVNMKGEIISGSYIKISKEDVLDYKVKKLEEALKKSQNELNKKLEEASKTIKEAIEPKEEKVEEVKEETKKETEEVKETKKTETKKTTSKRGRKKSTETKKEQ